MSLAIQSQVLHIQAVALPRDRTSHVQRAIDFCSNAWRDAYSIAKDKGKPEQTALRLACVAYKLAMPSMDTVPSIKATIACIAQGIRLEVFNGRDASQLLYSAQVALSLYKAKGGRK